MPIDPQTLESIRNPAAGLSNIGAMYAKGVEMKQNRESLEMEKQLAGLKIGALELEAKKDEVSYMGDSALSMKAYYDQGGDEEGAQSLWDTMRVDAESLGYDMPEQAPDADMAEGLASRSKQYINYLNATKASESVKKWQAIATIAAIPENKRTAEQTRILEALQKPTMISGVAQPSTRKTLISKNFIKSAKKGEIDLKGEIEGEKAYQDDIATRADAIQTEARANNEAISYSDALTQAHEESQYKLIETEGLPVLGHLFKKKFIYDPDAEPPPTGQPESGLSEEQMKAILKDNNLEDTQQNRDLVNKQYGDR